MLKVLYGSYWINCRCKFGVPQYRHKSALAPIPRHKCTPFNAKYGIVWCVMKEHFKWKLLLKSVMKARIMQCVIKALHPVCVVKLTQSKDGKIQSANTCIENSNPVEINYVLCGWDQNIVRATVTNDFWHQNHEYTEIVHYNLRNEIKHTWSQTCLQSQLYSVAWPKPKN